MIFHRITQQIASLVARQQELEKIVAEQAKTLASLKTIADTERFLKAYRSEIGTSRSTMSRRAGRA